MAESKDISTDLETTEPMESNETEPEVTPKEPDFCFEVLPLVKDAQNQHGLRHGDYQRYRMYCSRRLKRIRKSLNFTQSHRNRYQKKPITVSKINDIRYLYLPLVSAERAWAMAMELKQDANTEPRKRFHLMRRLGRAGKFSRELLELVERCERCDARSKLEVQAYLLWMTGNIKFEKQCWQKALDSYGQCQNIYEKLSGAVSEEQRVLYTQRVDEMSPSIRYCAYNIGGLPTDINELQKLRNKAAGSDILASKIDLVLAKTQEKAASSLTEVTWLGSKVPVRSEKVRVCLVRLQQVEGEMVSGGGDVMETYERLLMECQDALQVTKEELSIEQALAEKKKGAKNEAQRSSLRLLVDYLTHVKLNHAVNRNLALIANLREGERTAKPGEFVRVYDILLQHIADLGDLPGLAEDHTSQNQNTARTFAFKAHRCFHLAESYSTMKKWPEAMALFERASEHVIQAIEQYRVLENSGIEGSKIDKSIPNLGQLQSTIRGRKCEVHVSSVVEQQDLDKKMTNLSLDPAKPLTERLMNFSIPESTPVLAPFPPDYKPVAAKPLFFDLALNNLDLPSLEHRIEKKKGGITGFMKGLLWGN